MKAVLAQHGNVCKKLGIEMKKLLLFVFILSSVAVSVQAECDAACLADLEEFGQQATQQTKHPVTKTAKS